MWSRYWARLWCATVAGVALAAVGLAGPAGAAGASGAIAGRGAAGGPGASGGSTVPIPGGVISTVAGGVGGPGPGRSVAITPCGLRVAGSWLYIGTGSTIRRENTATGALTTVAGNNAAGPAGDGGSATATALGESAAATGGGPCGAAVDKAGSLAITDGQTVKLVAARTGTFYGQHMIAGHVYTVTGNPDKSRAPLTDPSPWPDGDGGPAAKALLGTADDVTFDRAGNMLIADTGRGAGVCSDDCPPVAALLRVVAVRTGRFYGVKMTGGHIYSIASLGPWLDSVEVDRSGNIILAGRDQPVFDPDEEDVVTPYVRVIAGVSGTFFGQKMRPGHIYHVAGDYLNQAPIRNGVPGTHTSMWAAGGAVEDLSGNLVIADGPEVRVVAVRSGRFYRQNMKAGYIYRIAGSPAGGYSGDGGPALRARVGASSIGLDRAGNIVAADRSGNRVRVIAARTGRFYGQKMTAGDIYTVAGNGRGFSGNGGPPLVAEVGSPGGISVSAGGDVAFKSSVFFFWFPPPVSSLQVVPARSGTLFGQKMTAGKLYTVAVHGGPFDFPGAASLAFDHGGNLVVADANDNKVWVVAATTGTFYGQAMKAGGMDDIAGSGQGGFSGDGGSAAGAMLNGPDGAAVDRDGNVLIVDSANNRIRVVAAANGSFYGQPMTAGDIYTIAGDGQGAYSGDGTPATAAGMSPVAVAADAAGNLIVTDASQRVLAVAAGTGTFYGQPMTAGDVYTIAGDGTSGFSGTGGPATAAELGAAGGVTIDRSGNVIIADPGNGVVWAVAAGTGTFYGQPMTAGDIYVVGGGGTAILGDGGPATQAEFNPIDVAVSAAGSLLVTDSDDNRVRAISP